MSIKNYSPEERTAITLSLMGEELAQIIMEMLPKDIVQNIEDKVIPIMDSLDLPEDIDDFVLNNIIKESSITNGGTENIDESPVLIEEIESVSEENNNKSPDKMSDDEILKKCPLSVITKTIGSENHLFRSLLIEFFPQERREEIVIELKNSNITVPASTQKTNIIQNMEKELFVAFVGNLRVAWQRVIN